MPTLAQYRLEVRRLLHDATGRFWSNAELNDYINDARLRVCSDTGCLRRLLSSYLSEGVEQYAIGAISGGIVLTGGTGYTGTPTVTITGDGEDATAEAVLGPSTGSGFVNALTVIPGSFFDVIPGASFAGGGGSGAAATIHMHAVELFVSVANEGTGYTVGDILSSTDGTSITPATAMVLAINGGGGVTNVGLVDGGEFTALPAGLPAVPVAFGGGTGTGAKFTTRFGIGPVTITAGGTGYTSAPAVTLTSPGTGVGAAIIAAIGGGSPIASITITDGGQRYTEATITITGSGTGATAVAALIPADTLDIMNITPIWGNQRIPMRYMPFTEFNARMRTFFINPQRPCVWSRYGTSGGTAFVQPVPDQLYATEFDTAIIPQALDDDDEVDIIMYPYTSPVAYYACWKAKMKQQAFSEGEVFLADYKRKVLEAQASVQMRRIPNPYYGYTGA